MRLARRGSTGSKGRQLNSKRLKNSDPRADNKLGTHMEISMLVLAIVIVWVAAAVLFWAAWTFG